MYFSRERVYVHGKNIHAATQHFWICISLDERSTFTEKTYTSEYVFRTRKVYVHGKKHTLLNMYFARERSTFTKNIQAATQHFPFLHPESCRSLHEAKPSLFVRVTFTREQKNRRANQTSPETNKEKMFTKQTNKEKIFTKQTTTLSGNLGEHSYIYNQRMACVPKCRPRVESRWTRNRFRIPKNFSSTSSLFQRDFLIFS